MFGSPDMAFRTRYGNNIKPQEIEHHCLCGHLIVEQCYLCPEYSNNIEYIIVLGNHCIEEWGYEAAIRGKGVKVKCEYCNSTVNKTGLRRHQTKTNM